MSDRKDPAAKPESSAEMLDLIRIGQMVPQEVERQHREYRERIELAERVFGEALREIDRKARG